MCDKVIRGLDLKRWHISYKGLWLGGTAIVLAHSEEEAIELVRDHPDTLNFEDYFVAELEQPLGSCVLYNNNGDY